VHNSGAHAAVCCVGSAISLHRRQGVNQCLPHDALACACIAYNAHAVACTRRLKQLHGLVNSGREGLQARPRECRSDADAEGSMLLRLAQRRGYQRPRLLEDVAKEAVKQVHVVLRQLRRTR